MAYAKEEEDPKILAIICTNKLPFHLVTQWPFNILLPGLAILSGLRNTPETVSTFIIISKLCEKLRSLNQVTLRPLFTE